MTRVVAVATLALKEWAAVAHALLQGSQTVLLRKGGIHERAFAVPGAGGFVVYPTVEHSHQERVRPEHADLLPLGEADVRESHFVVRCGVEIVGVVPVARPSGLDDIADLHILTADSVRLDRLEFRPRHPLQALVVAAVELPEPTVLPRLDAYGGCRSWLDLPLSWSGAGRRVHTRERLDADLRRVREAVADA
jgi:hypothetical protein